jgi:hypothetical protein
VTRLLTLLVALPLAAPVRAADTDPLFPNDDTSARLRVEVTTEGTAPEVAWTTFLDKLFAHFDRDGNGTLSPAEAKRVFSLPLPGGREAALDFTALDTNRDGKGTPEEFRAFYRARVHAGHGCGADGSGGCVCLGRCAVHAPRSQR